MTTQVFSCWHDAQKKVSSGSKFATLLVPDGSWFIVAKVNVDNDNTSTYQTLTARLIAGVDFDTNHIRLGPSGVHSVDVMALAFTLVHTFPGASNQPQNTIDLEITLDPAGPSAFVSAGQVKITAIRVDSIVNHAI